MVFYWNTNNVIPDPGKQNGEVFFCEMPHCSILHFQGLLSEGPTTVFHNGMHNSPIYDECQTHYAWGLILPWKRAHQDNSNDTPQPIPEFQVGFPLLRIRINQDKPKSTVKGSQLDTYLYVVGYHLNCLDELVFIAVSKPLVTVFGIHLRLESCVPFFDWWNRTKIEI